MVSALDVARQFVLLAERDGELVDQLRLYKLMYYAQGWALAWYKEPLFADRIEAWPLGPVPAETRGALQAFGKNPVRDLGPPESLTDRAGQIIESVWHGYRKHSSIGLSELTHQEAPWKDAYRPANGAAHAVISEDALCEYFGAVHERETGEPAGSLAEADRAYHEGRTVSLDDVLEELSRP